MGVFCAAASVLLCAGAGFLLWELSTPFVHLRWLLHKSGRDKKRIYVVNGLLMVVVFFLCRPVWGTWLSYKVGRSSWRSLYAACAWDSVA